MRCTYYILLLCLGYIGAVSQDNAIPRAIVVGGDKPEYSAIYHIIRNERAVADTHYCLYHGLDKEVFIDLLANTYLDHFINGTPLSDDFIKLRTDFDLRRTDYLYMNVSFPGCLRGGCNTLEYFKYNRSMQHQLGRHIVSYYTRDKNIKSELYRCLEQIQRYIDDYRRNVVIQLCVPHMYVDMYTKLERVNTHSKKTSEILDMYRHRMDQLRKHLDPKDIFGTIQLNQKLFSQPGCIKMYAYHSFPQEVYTRLYNEISHILKKHGVIS